MMNKKDVFILWFFWLGAVLICINAYRVKAPAAPKVLKAIIWATVVFIILYSCNQGDSKSLTKTPEQFRIEKIDAQFDSWDGSHRNLEELIKADMHNPDSYKHIETRRYDNVDYLVVQTKFSGTNAFGGVVSNTVRAKVDLDGNILEILDQK